ncbi:MAG: hypothetical protein OEY36_01010 [Gammaproteobacteria bacterium]|nr:hypothetical protein [Gammaproteobacteria bacterium]
MQSAWAFTIDQQIKYAPVFSDSELIGEDIALHNASYRLNYSAQINNFSADLHYQILSVNSNHSITAADTDQYHLFDLSDTLTSADRHYSYHRLDRLVITHQSERIVTRVGRQAITWGNGFVFNTMDIFNPFAPTAIDKEYKSGDDMLYSQFVTESGNDWQLIHLPRRNQDGLIRNDVSSSAIKYHHSLQAGDFDVLLAQHYDAGVFGFGFSKNLSDSVWRIDITSSRNTDDKTVTSLSSNLDYSWQSFGNNIYGFIEYYYNGFGIESSADSADIFLLEKIQRGELFTLYQQYLAAGLQIEWHPLLTVSPTLITNLTDQSTLLSLSIHYNWLQNLVASAGIVLATGSSTSEFSNNSASANTAQLLITYYF